jgi:hypothetical protein
LGETSKRRGEEGGGWVPKVDFLGFFGLENAYLKINYIIEA